MKVEGLNYDISDLKEGLIKHLKNKKIVKKYYPFKLKKKLNNYVRYSRGAPLYTEIPYYDITQYRNFAREYKNPPKKLLNVYKNYIDNEINVLFEYRYSIYLTESFIFNDGLFNFRASLNGYENKKPELYMINGFIKDSYDNYVLMCQVSKNSPYLDILQVDYNSEKKPVFAKHFSIGIKSNGLRVSGSIKYEYTDGRINNIVHSSGKYYLKNGKTTRDKI